MTQRDRERRRSDGATVQGSDNGVSPPCPIHSFRLAPAVVRNARVVTALSNSHRHAEGEATIGAVGVSGSEMDRAAVRCAIRVWQSGTHQAHSPHHLDRPHPPAPMLFFFCFCLVEKARCRSNCPSQTRETATDKQRALTQKGRGECK